MSVHPVYFSLDIIIVLFNITLTVLCFGINKRRRIPALIFGVLVWTFNSVIWLHPVTAAFFESIPVSLLWIVFVCLFCEGRLFAKLFIFFGVYYITMYLYVTSSFITELFFDYESTMFFIVMPVLCLLFFSGYGLLVKKYAKGICKKLFTYSRPLEWALYMVIPVCFMAVIGYGYLTQGEVWYPVPLEVNAYFILMPTVMLACYVAIISAVLNTHDKAKNKYEAEFASNIISAGRDYYQKIDEMYDKMRVLRHDQKYHLSAARKMLDSGDANGATSYIEDVERQLSDVETKSFCSNAVVNALVGSYSERCAKLGIRFEVNLKVPQSLGIPDYDLCIVLGNLLENAVEACRRMGNNGFIKLETQNTKTQLLFMVRNSFDGVIQHEDGTPQSAKINRGFGLRSVNEVISRHNGDFTMKWDANTFTVFVAVRL